MLQFDMKRLLYTKSGRVVLSILLGLGLASLFHKVCKNKDCIQFQGPVIQDVDQQTFQFDDKCYQYEAVPVTCDGKKKKIVSFSNGKTTLNELFSNPMKTNLGAGFTEDKP